MCHAAVTFTDLCDERLHKGVQEGGQTGVGRDPTQVHGELPHGHDVMAGVPERRWRENRTITGPSPRQLRRHGGRTWTTTEEGKQDHHRTITTTAETGTIVLAREPSARHVMVICQYFMYLDILGMLKMQSTCTKVLDKYIDKYQVRFKYFSNTEGRAWQCRTCPSFYTYADKLQPTCTISVTSSRRTLKMARL